MGHNASLARAKVWEAFTIDAGAVWDIGGTQVTATATELNILDGVTATAAELNIMDGVTATSSEINLLDNQPASVTWTVGNEAADVINVQGAIKDTGGAALDHAVQIDFYVANDSTGLNIGTAPNGGIAASTIGKIAAEPNADIVLRFITNAIGVFNMDITETGTGTWYPVAVLPNGALAVGKTDAITFA